LFNSCFDITTVGIESPATSLANVSVYPNPSHDVVTIQLPDATTSYTIEIFNTGGQLIQHATGVKQRYQFDTSLLSKGIYLYKITTSGTSTSGKLVVQ
ncbi:MAG TPA: T9SS type A sorting domain-containing protein, partial [Bacteroidia bacterium]|nr:T9SS type A sorting domain-containing protein [Bacteroidia bacterium]